MTAPAPCWWLLLALPWAAAAVIFLGLFHLTCRLRAERCPNCRSRRGTELMGEWGSYAEWGCHRCGYYWVQR